MAAVHEQGHRVPEDIALVAFDGIEAGAVHESVIDQCPPGQAGAGSDGGSHAAIQYKQR